MSFFFCAQIDLFFNGSVNGGKVKISKGMQYGITAPGFAT